MSISEFWTELASPTSVSTDDPQGPSGPEAGDVWLFGDRRVRVTSVGTFDGHRVVRAVELFDGVGYLATTISYGYDDFMAGSDFGTPGIRIGRSNSDQHVDAKSGLPVIESKWRAAIEDKGLTFLVRSVVRENDEFLVKVARQGSFTSKTSSYVLSRFFDLFRPHASTKLVAPEPGDVWQSRMFTHDTVTVDRCEVIRSGDLSVREIVHAREEASILDTDPRSWDLADFVERFRRIQPPEVISDDEPVEPFLEPAAIAGPVKTPESFRDDPFNTRDMIIPGQRWIRREAPPVQFLVLFEDIFDDVVHVRSLDGFDIVNAIPRTTFRRDLKFLAQPKLPMAGDRVRYVGESATVARTVVEVKTGVGIEPFDYVEVMHGDTRAQRGRGTRHSPAEFYRNYVQVPFAQRVAEEDDPFQNVAT